MILIIYQEAEKNQLCAKGEKNIVWKMGEKFDVILKPNGVIFLDVFLWNAKFSFPNGEKNKIISINL
jgi:hypothetical protein